MAKEAKPKPFQLRTQALDGNLQYTDVVAAVYRMASQRVSFRTDTDVDQVNRDAAARIAQLVDRRFQVRKTTRPFPVPEWAQAVYADVMPGTDVTGLPAGTPGVPLPGFLPNLDRTQRHLMQLDLSETEAYLSVQLGRRIPSSQVAGAAGWHRDLEAKHVEKDRHQVDQIVAGAGLAARPVTVEDLTWLLDRSLALGMPSPARRHPLHRTDPDGRRRPVPWTETDMPGLTESVVWHAEAFDRTVTVTAVVNGDKVRRHVVVLTLGRLEELNIPAEDDPWMQLSDRAPFPVEWVYTADVLQPDVTVKRMRRQVDRIASQIVHFMEEHGMRPPAALLRQEQRAHEIEDEMQTGITGLATRCDVWARIAVAGATEREALDRAKYLQDLYGPRVNLETGYDQHARALEFVPGEKLADTAHKRQMRVDELAAAMPSATARIGHREGFHWGNTCGTTKRAVLWAPWHAMEVDEKQGLTLISAEQGGGKSTAIGKLLYETVLAGVPWSVLEPAERLQAVTRLPELAPYSQYIPLLHADPGTLCPNRVVAEPNRDHYRYDDDGRRRSDDDQAEAWQRARRMARATRRALNQDTLLGLLDKQISDSMATRLAMGKAVRMAPAGFVDSPRDVLEALRTLGDSNADLGVQLADLLEEAAELPQGQLIFPPGYLLDYERNRRNEATPLLKVYGLKGLVQRADNTDGRDLTTDERYSGPIMNLAAYLTKRDAYDTSPDERKGMALDEGHAITEVQSGRKLVNETVRYSRKHNLRFVMASQLVTDSLTAGVAAHVDSVLIGRTTDPAAQAAALDVLHVRQGVGYEQILGSLSPQAAYDDDDEAAGDARRGPREFVFSDGRGGVERIEIDLSGTPELLAALDTTADPHRARTRRVEELRRQQQETAA